MQRARERFGLCSEHAAHCEGSLDVSKPHTPLRRRAVQPSGPDAEKVGLSASDSETSPLPSRHIKDEAAPRESVTCSGALRRSEAGDALGTCNARADHRPTPSPASAAGSEKTSAEVPKEARRGTVPGALAAHAVAASSQGKAEPSTFRQAVGVCVHPGRQLSEAKLACTSRETRQVPASRMQTLPRRSPGTKRAAPACFPCGAQQSTCPLPFLCGFIIAPGWRPDGRLSGALAGRRGRHNLQLLVHAKCSRSSNCAVRAKRLWYSTPTRKHPS